MEFLSFLPLGFAPGIFWLWYFYRKDVSEPEPVHLVLKVFFFGCLITVPTSLISGFLYRDEYTGAILVAPIVEESAKFFVVWKFAYKRSDFNEPLDGVVYAAAAALGFASIENGLYFFNAWNSNTLGPNFIVRSLLSTPGHVLFSSFWGYALGKAKFMKGPNVGLLILKYLFYGMVAHSLFNVAASVFWELMALVTSGLWRLMNGRISEGIALSPFKKRNRSKHNQAPALKTNHQTEVAAFPQTINCPNCEKQLQLSLSERESREFVCPECNYSLSIPAQEPIVAKKVRRPFSRFVKCKNCGTKVELTMKEKNEGIFVCPECFKRNDSEIVSGT